MVVEEAGNGGHDVVVSEGGNETYISGFASTYDMVLTINFDFAMMKHRYRIVKGFLGNYVGIDASIVAVRYH